MTSARAISFFIFVFVDPGMIPDHPSNCRFTGQKDQEEIRIWLRAADCLLLPTYTEAAPVAVMEAFALRVPISYSFRLRSIHPIQISSELQLQGRLESILLRKSPS
ncbi:MAG: glycosyltransferase [Methanomicrobiales archaeon]|nr:glycosyltransferase [Methanomicrobiales archaeon]